MKLVEALLKLSHKNICDGYFYTTMKEKYLTENSIVVKRSDTFFITLKKCI